MKETMDFCHRIDLASYQKDCTTQITLYKTQHTAECVLINYNRHTHKHTSIMVISGCYSPGDTSSNCPSTAREDRVDMYFDLHRLITGGAWMSEGQKLSGEEIRDSITRSARRWCTSLFGGGGKTENELWHKITHEQLESEELYHSNNAIREVIWIFL